MKKVLPNNTVLIPEQARRVFKGEIYDVYQWPQKLFDGTHATFEMLKRPDTVTVIPIIRDKILTIEDEQPHRGAKMSFPGGRVDESDESTLKAAMREVKEEIGYEFDKWKLVKVWQPHTKIEWFIYFYVAWEGSKTTSPHPDPGEKIKLKELSFDDAKSLVLKNSGYLGESKEIFERVDSLRKMFELPEIHGVEIES